VARVESEVCGDCEGKGVVLKTNGWMLFDGKCKRCSGTGRIQTTKPLNH
jgi:DnaJ-class molecular chaperone